MKAAAVERLMPAKQWTTIGAPAVPASDEIDELVDMGLGWQDKALDRLYDVVHAEDQVIGRGNAASAAARGRRQAQQGHHVAGAGFRDGVVQAGEGADVNHEPSYRTTKIVPSSWPRAGR